MTSLRCPCEFLSQIKQGGSVNFPDLYVFLRNLHDKSQKWERNVRPVRAGFTSAFSIPYESCVPDETKPLQQKSSS